MIKNTGSQSIGVQMITASDGSAFTGTTTVYVTGDAGTQALGAIGSGVCTSEGNGYHTYVPSQAETNYSIIGFTFTGTGAIPVTIQVFTQIVQQTADHTAGVADIPTVSEFNARSLPSADYTIVSDLGTVQTGDSYAIVNGAHGLVSIQDDVDLILADTADMQPRVAAIEIDTETTIPGTITTAQNDLDILTGADGAILNTTQANYAPNVVVPDAAGVAATPAEVATALTNYGANTTTPPTVAEIQAEMEENGASLLDTIRDELANGTDGLSALKTLIDAISTKTTNLPADPASETNVNANETKIDAMQGNVTDILTDTEDIQTQIGTDGDGLTSLPDVTLANGAHGGAAAALTLASYTDFTGAAASNPNLLLDTTVASLTSQTVFVLTAGSDIADTYNGQAIVLYDASNSDFPSIRVVSDYSATTRQITLDSAPDFTLVGSDVIKIFVTAPGTSAPTVGQIRTEMDDNSTQLAAIVEDTSTTIPDTITTIDNEIAAMQSNVTDILADTNELRGDDIPAAITALDAVVDTVKAETALIVADTEDIQSRIPDALVGGGIKSDVLSISGSTDAADKLEASAETIVVGAAEGTPTTTVMQTDLSEATDDHYNGRIIIWTSGVLQNQATDITDYTGATGTLTFTAVTEAATATDTFVIV
jgi:hypothetical protein